MVTRVRAVKEAYTSVRGVFLESKSTALSSMAWDDLAIELAALYYS